MIAKKIPKKQTGSPKSLIQYITDGGGESSDKCIYTNSRYILTDLEEIEEMIKRAKRSRKNVKPLEHYIFSWAPDEEPTKEEVEDLIDSFIAKAGIEECPIVYAVHGDREHTHLHIALCRVREDEYGDIEVVKINKGFDVRVLHEVCREISRKYGWSFFVGKGGDKEKNTQSPALTYRGEKAAEDVIREALQEIHASTWEEFTWKLQRQGIHVYRRGQGIVFVHNETPVKGSTIGKEYTKKRLEEKYGPLPDFVEVCPKFPPNNTPSSSKSNPGTNPDYELYKEVKAEERAIRKIYRAREQEIWKRRKRGIKRELSYAFLSALMGKRAAAAFFRAYDDEIRKQIQKNRQEMEEKIRELYRPYGVELPTPEGNRGVTCTYATWKKCRAQAVDPEIKEVMEVMSVGQNQQKQVEPYAQTVLPEKIRYEVERYIDTLRPQKIRVTIRYEEGPTFVAGEFRVSDSDEHEKMMRAIIKFSRHRGAHIYLTPLSDEYVYPIIDDVETQEYAMKVYDTVQGSYIMETSPNRYQIILRVPRKEEYTREGLNAFVRSMNQMYGDPHFTGIEHPHRTPGTLNPKPKYEKDGIYPEVRVLCACARNSEYARQWLDEYTRENPHRETAFQFVNRRQYSDAEKHALATIFEMHAADLQNFIGKIYSTPPDLSRIDYMAAVRMRVMGFDADAIREALYATNDLRPEGKKKRYIDKYVERTVAAAFSLRGDRDVEKQRHKRSVWCAMCRDALEVLGIAPVSASKERENEVREAMEKYIGALRPDQIRLTIKDEASGTAFKIGEFDVNDTEQYEKMIRAILKFSKQSGTHVYITPLSDAYVYPIFDHIEGLQSAERMYEQYQGSVIIEDAPSRYQVILRVPKPETEVDDFLLRTIVRRHNIDYGGVVWGHRAPATYHPRHDGHKVHIHQSQYRTSEAMVKKIHEMRSSEPTQEQIARRLQIPPILPKKVCDMTAVEKEHMRFIYRYIHEDVWNAMRWYLQQGSEREVRKKLAHKYYPELSPDEITYEEYEEIERQMYKEKRAKINEGKDIYMAGREVYKEVDEEVLKIDPSRIDYISAVHMRAMGFTQEQVRYVLLHEVNLVRFAERHKTHIDEYVDRVVKTAYGYDGTRYIYSHLGIEYRYLDRLETELRSLNAEWWYMMVKHRAEKQRQDERV
jgi:hypothetical protein